MPERDASRLLCLSRTSGTITHRRFRDLPSLLVSGDLLVLNDTRVLPGRLVGRRPGGAPAEVLLLRPRREPDEQEWECLVRPGRRLKAGTEITFAGGVLSAEVRGGTEDGIVRVAFHSAVPLAEAFRRVGQAPVPPYIRKLLKEAERYQTVYARAEGSAAAPTAGLHFTHALLEALPTHGIAVAWITLHIGLDTFRRVESEEIEGHPMHREWCTVPEATAQAIATTRARGGRIVAGGTTVVRTLEASVGPAGEVSVGERWTDLFVRPGHRFLVIDALLTNFHLPRSTLLMLVAAFAGLERVRRAYTEAIAARYRFYSFGDAMLVT